MPLYFMVVLMYSKIIIFIYYLCYCLLYCSESNSNICYFFKTASDCMKLPKQQSGCAYKFKSVESESQSYLQNAIDRSHYKFLKISGYNTKNNEDKKSAIKLESIRIKEELMKYIVFEVDSNDFYNLDCIADSMIDSDSGHKSDSYASKSIVERHYLSDYNKKTFKACIEYMLQYDVCREIFALIVSKLKSRTMFIESIRNTIETINTIDAEYKNIYFLIFIYSIICDKKDRQSVFNLINLNDDKLLSGLNEYHKKINVIQTCDDYTIFNNIKNGFHDLFYEYQADGVISEYVNKFSEYIKKKQDIFTGKKSKFQKFKNLSITNVVNILINVLNETLLFNKLLILHDNKRDFYSRYGFNSNIICLSLNEKDTSAFLTKMQDGRAYFRSNCTTICSTIFHEATHLLHYLLSSYDNSVFDKTVNIAKFVKSILTKVKMEDEIVTTESDKTTKKTLIDLKQYLTDDEEFLTMHGYFYDYDKLYYSYFNENMYNISTSYSFSDNKYAIDLHQYRQPKNKNMLSYRMMHDDCKFLGDYVKVFEDDNKSALESGGDIKCCNDKIVRYFIDRSNVYSLK